MQPVLDHSVVAQQRRELLRRGLLGARRGERIADFATGLAGLDMLLPTFDENGLLAAVKGRIVVSFLGADVFDPVEAALDPTMLF